MLTPLDNSLFLEKIKLVKTPNEWIYPIFKNGSSTIFNYCEEHDNFDLILYQPNFEIEEITVFIRDPIERYKSGLQTMVYNLTQKYSFLDYETVSFMAQKYLFLDMHFLPQFHWLLNLARVVGSRIPLNFKPIDDIDLIFLNNQHRTPEKKTNITIDKDNFSNLYLQLDTIIFNFIGNTITFDELLNFIKNDKDAKFDEIINFPKSLIRILD